MDLLLSGQLLFSALVLGALYALVAVGLNLVYGTMRLLNVAHGDLIMIGAYAAFWLFSLLSVSPLISLAAAALATGLLGATIYLGLFRGLLADEALLARLEANSLLIFFGVSVILQNLAALAFSASPRAYQYLDQVIVVAGVSMTGNRIAALVVAFAICLGLMLFLRYSLTGLAIKALIQNTTAAKIVGIKVERVRFFSFCVGFATAGLAGALLSMTEQVSPFMGFPFTIAAFVVIILGGLGKIPGGILAAFLLSFVEIYGVALTSPTYASILLYGSFVAILVIRPQGLFGGHRIAR